jgi:hypothetical protein
VLEGAPEELLVHKVPEVENVHTAYFQTSFQRV